MRTINQFLSQTVWAALAVVTLGPTVANGAMAANQSANQVVPLTGSIIQVPHSVALSDTTIGKIITMYTYQRGLGKYHSAEFGTDGQRVGGLTADELNKRFDHYLSVASPLNFLVGNGYRVINFSRAKYGYFYLLEKVR